MPSSTHFSDAELACPHCGVNGTGAALVQALEELRRRVSNVAGKDTAVMVNSAYRCPAHNAAVGGVPNSQHVQGIAADVRVIGWTAAQLLEVVTTVPGVTAYGRADYQGYVHMDTRQIQGAHVVRWCYGPDGKEVAWYEAPAAASA